MAQHSGSKQSQDVLGQFMREHAISKRCAVRVGKRIGISDPTTGQIREAEIFVGVLGASNLTLTGFAASLSFMIAHCQEVFRPDLQGPHAGSGPLSHE